MIAYFLYNLSKYSGAAQQALLLARSVGRPVVIFNHERNARYARYRINNLVQVINLPASKPAAFVCLLYYLLVYRIKIIHLHGFFKHGIVLGRALRKKIILKTTLMDSDDFSTLYRKARNKRLIQALFGWVDINICLTKSLMERNRDYIEGSKIRVVPNGVEVQNKFYEHKENLFCFVGLVCERKATLDSIKYYLNNYRSLPGSKMYVIGPVDGLEESDFDYVERCYSLISEFNAGQEVIFTGNLSKDEVCAYLGRAKALLFFSKREGMPNVVLEAMASNCVPVTSGIDGISADLLGEELDAKITVFNKSDVISIGVIDELIESKALLKRVDENFSIGKVSEKYNFIYEELLS